MVTTMVPLHWHSALNQYKHPSHPSTNVTSNLCILNRCYMLWHCPTSGPWCPLHPRLQLPDCNGGKSLTLQRGGLGTGHDIVSRWTHIAVF